MANKLLTIKVKGKLKNWSFEFMGDPKYIPEWAEDGLIVEEVCNTIPLWVCQAGLVKPWCFLQDVFNFKNPWGNR